MKKFLVIGSGSWGLALAILLVRNGYDVSLWSAVLSELDELKNNHRSSYLPSILIPKEISICATLEKALEEVNYIVLAVPSHFFCSTLQILKPFFLKNKKLNLVWGTKGLDEKHRLLHESVYEVLGKVPMAVISGPSFAREVAAGLPTAVVIAANQKKLAENLAIFFHNDAFRVYTSNDLVGVGLCGAIKNVLAIAIGIADGMGFGANTQAALMTRGLAEMVRLGTAFGGKQKTFVGLAGIGDLILTCTDNQSRNRRFGLAVGKGLKINEAEKDIGKVVEGLINSKKIYFLARNKKIEMPIVEQVYKILHEKLSPKTAIALLLKRERRKDGE